ncbi:MAG: DHH family phosphoesterase [Clostridia bacterium]|nr:DHH family phosphoesterase [Clostridia bacterium]
MSDFPCLTPDEVCDTLLAAERPIVLSHAHPDGDTVGSAAALCHILARLHKKAAWRCADPLPRRLAFLFDGLDMATAEENKGGTVIAVDVASPMQLGSLAEEYLPGGVHLMLDHHEVGCAFAPSLICPHAAAAGEVIYHLAERLCARGALTKIDVSVAGAIYAAISSDTGCFKYSNVTAETHRIAAALHASGIQADKINHLLYDSRTPEQLAAEKIAMSRLSVHAGGRIGAVCLTLADRAGLSDDDFETAVDIPRSMAGVEIALVVRELPGGVSKVSLRSVEANVSAVAQAFGGGGHVRAAGCTLNGCPEDVLATIMPTLLEALGK